MDDEEKKPDEIPVEVTAPAEPVAPLESVGAENTAEGPKEETESQKKYRKQREQQHLWGEVPIRTVYGYNYTLAFVLMVNGMNLVDIARDHKFDFQKLSTRARREKWRVQAVGSWEKLYRKERKNPDESSEMAEGEIPKLVEKRIGDISKNRDKVVRMADDLRGLINKVAAALDKLNLESADDEKLGNVAKSIGSLTKAAKDIADMTMVALGDEHAIRHLGAGLNKHNGGRDGPAIVINMPGILATSRRRMKPADRVESVLEEIHGAEKSAIRKLHEAAGGLNEDTANGDDDKAGD